jgi:hypothetical protein
MYSVIFSPMPFVCGSSTSTGRSAKTHRWVDHGGSDEFAG